MNVTHFSPRINSIIQIGRVEAARLCCYDIRPEHLLLAMMKEAGSLFSDLLRFQHIDKESLKTALEKNVKEDESMVTDIQSIMLNPVSDKLLKLAVLEARIDHAAIVDVEHLLLAILHDPTRNGAKTILQQNNMNYEDTKRLLQKVKNGAGLTEEEDNSQQQTGNKPSSTNTQQAPNNSQGSKTPVLDNFSVDLTQAAADGKLDPCVGREREIQRLIEILNRRKKNNPILIGEPGVGKSAIVEGLAQLITAKRTSPMLFGKRVVNLDMTGIVAGTKYRGQFEERLKALLKELEQNPDIIVFIDEIHTMIGAGSAPGSMDAANILKPALARGTIQCIGATTLDEYRNSIEKDGALERRFQKVMVEPTTTEQTIQILQNIKSRYEQHHHVCYTDDAIVTCVRLTDRYINDRFFPDKAIDAMDEVGAKIHLQHAQVPPEITEKEKAIKRVKQLKQEAVNNQDFERAASYRDEQTKLEDQLANLNKAWAEGENGTRETVSEQDVADVVSMMTGIPVQRMAEAEGIRLKTLSADLKKNVIAQDFAIDKMVKAIQRNRVGLKDPNHPIGVFMFLGPTGVGKTYLAKELAKHMFGSADALIRIDMSEYTESFNVSRLVGAPPGYVGYEEGGQLTEQVRRHPYSIVLLDEIEKAHGNVFNLLLQVLDEGRLTDGNGRLVDFRNTIIIMTSNAGTRQLKEFGRGVGFTAGGHFGSMLNDQDKEYARQIIQKSLSKQFAPEFLNRLDEIITFDQLDIEAIKRIIDIELTGLKKRVEVIGYQLELTDDAKDFIATKGYDVQFGARPLKRALQTYVEDLICEHLLDASNKEHKTGNTLETIRIDKEPEKETLIIM